MKNLISSFLVKVFIKKGKVVSNQKVGDHFQLLTIELPKKKEWIPGDKVQIKVNGTNLRSYTPIKFQTNQKTFTTLIYNHQKGPGSIWSENAKSKDQIEILGPRRSLITEKEKKYILVGDETTYGLVRSLLDAGVNLKYFLKCTYTSEINAISNLLDLDKNYFFEKYEDIYNQLPLNSEVNYILTGHKDAISCLELFLINQNIKQEQLVKKVYWFNKK